MLLILELYNTWCFFDVLFSSRFDHIIWLHWSVWLLVFTLFMALFKHDLQFHFIYAHHNQYTLISHTCSYVHEYEWNNKHEICTYIMCDLYRKHMKHLFKKSLDLCAEKISLYVCACAFFSLAVLICSNKYLTQYTQYELIFW